MSIKAVLKLINKLHTSACAEDVLGVAIAILNMNTKPNASVVYFPLHEPPILLPLPHAQSTLPCELVLVSTTIPEANLHMIMDGKNTEQVFCREICYPPVQMYPACIQTIPS